MPSSHSVPLLPAQRTLGLMLALGGVGLFLGLAPIALPGLVALINLSGHKLLPDDPAFWLPAAFGLIVLIATVAAWIGRPPATRQAFITAATLSLGVNFVINSRATLFTGPYGSTLDSAIHAAGLCLISLQFIVYVFSLWYVNRAPARAFYTRARASTPDR